jgi:hypothetical protein
MPKDPKEHAHWPREWRCALQASCGGHRQHPGQLLHPQRFHAHAFAGEAGFRQQLRESFGGRAISAVHGREGGQAGVHEG